MIRGLYAIVDPALSSGVPIDTLARDYLEGGASIIQLRCKEDVEQQVEHAQKIIQLKKKYSFLFIINDEPEVVDRVGADGVHLGQEDMDVSVARGLLGPKKIIGKSTHSLIEARSAWEEEVDYIAVGAIYPTTSKPLGHPVVGLTMLENICERSPKPVVAIGGINRRNVKQVIKAGASSVALISALSQAKDRVAAARYFSDLFKSVPD